MSEEEKKAIERVKSAIENDKKNRIVTIYDEKPLFREVLQTLLNLIEKQAKEIEELKKDNEYQWEHRCKMAIELDNNVVSKDKIMEIAKEYIEDETIDLHLFYMKVMRLLEE